MLEINTDSINGAIKNFELLDDGSLLCWITIGCTGELKYQHNGKERIEVVNSDTLYGDDSINTSIGRPVVLNHPPMPLITNLAQRKRFERGTTLQQIVKNTEDGVDYLNIASLITEPNLIKMIMNGEIQQVSPCYKSKKEQINADSNDLRYLQTNRKYNHFAFCQEGRHGDKVKVYLSGVNCDSKEEIMEVAGMVELHVKYGDLMREKGIEPSYDWDSLTLKQNVLKAINPSVDPANFDEVNCDAVISYTGEQALKTFKQSKESTKTDTKQVETKQETKPETKQETKPETIVTVPETNADSVNPIFNAEKKFIELVQSRNKPTK